MTTNRHENHSRYTDAHGSTEQIEFELADRKGRKIGARIWRGVRTVTAIPCVEVPKGEAGPKGAPAKSYARWVNTETGEDVSSWSNVAPGVYFTFQPHATRNGVWYGASQRTQLFATVEEREAAVARYLVQARKAAAKKA